MSKFRIALTIVVCLAFIGPAGMAAADDFPSKPIYMIVGYNPGGGTDMNARALASAATEYLNNQPLVIVNKPGAQGLLGPKFVATAKPDGYTLSMGWGNSEFSFGQYLMNIPFDWKKFKPIIAYVGRLDTQKGVHLIRHALFWALENGAQFVLLGTSPEQGINEHFWRKNRIAEDCR